MIEQWLGNLDKLLTHDVPGGFSIYQHARAAYVAGDIEKAEKLKRLNYLLHNSEVPYTAQIGKNSILAYGGIGIILHAQTRIGERCNIGSGVTIGGSASGVPIIGHDVYLSTGCKILGGLKIGDGAIIGANAVVLNDVKPFTVVAGLPAKPISDITPENFDKYAGFYWCKNQPEKVALFIDWYFTQKRAEMPR
ncbi:hypothetical protein ORJ00_09865 [Rheinheimera baltica]|uniref:hypothetical protein n=1 Tax=Rheinheimera baltica TaxID=67576 RepID=UPI00273F82FB|nr:hypothetical protein [Rheinheimera baltica]MDP5143049.1 hypothetical protein [Rheinheimera baltica]